MSHSIKNPLLLSMKQVSFVKGGFNNTPKIIVKTGGGDGNGDLPPKQV
ncbi:hypothetical protein [Pseudoalteromonas obscura]|uniref:Obg domain-containing protein n=1 Tax=Pseudoalteromonas obscura TaxID=3048491 RepID=A0ABT7EK84_9GAMM|nr:hypothetical protein [Pseudoalteromonas sp. P94(2023)]MDK2595428.1 hypothetical protein [Pseudoalteromonas sp. P94(2023)]